jgi:curli biogenesis system outer membrane secretion channel CsgG
MTRTWTLVVVMASCVAAVPAPVAGQGKPRVAVLSFADDAVRGTAARVLGGSQDVGVGVADVLVQKLIDGGQFTLVERNALDAVLKEQNFSNSDRADAATAARIGRVLGVDAIVLGSVMRFAVEETSTSNGRLGRLGGVLGPLEGRLSKAIVTLNARLVDTTTGEVMAAASGDAERNGPQSLSTSAGGTSVGLSSAAFGDSLVGKALGEAADEVAQQLNGYGVKLAKSTAVYDGVIADVSGRTLIVNVGRKNGAKVGDRLEITRVVRTIPDPQNPSRILRTVTETIATAEVTEVDDVSATATVAGNASLKVGDTVRRAQ